MYLRSGPCQVSAVFNETGADSQVIMSWDGNTGGECVPALQSPTIELVADKHKFEWCAKIRPGEAHPDRCVGKPRQGLGRVPAVCRSTASMGSGVQSWTHAWGVCYGNEEAWVKGMYL